MAKRLIFTNTFNPGSDSVTVSEIVDPKRLLLITNVTTNQTLYLFNTPGFGYTSVSYDYENYSTTYVLETDCSLMTASDKIQIFVEEDSTLIAPEDTYTDPVSKIRVSNPENLIDTDFEYGLQSTKWETLELTNNIPTFFSRTGDSSLGLVAVSTVSGSSAVTVETSAAHNLQRGSPVIVSGTSDITTDGGFLVSSIIDDTSFTYTSKAVQTSSGSILETATQVFPGSIYSGTEFKLSNVEGVTTDGADPSTLTVNTQYPTNFTNGTSFVLSNTFAKSSLSLDTSNVEVGGFDSVTASYTSNTATGETDNWSLGGVMSSWTIPDSNAIFFEEGSTDVFTILSGYRFVFAQPHGFSTYDQVVYMCDTGTNTQMSGLENFKSYWVYAVSSTELELRSIRSTSITYRITGIGYGSSGGIMKSCFAETFPVNQTSSSTRYMYMYDTDMYNKSNSGMTTTKSDNRFAFMQMYNVNYQYYTAVNDIWDARSSAYDYWAGYVNTSLWTASSTSTGGNLYFPTQSNDFALLPIKEESTLSGSFYLPAHGFSEDQIVVLTATVGTLPGGLVSGNTYTIGVHDENRVYFKTTTGSRISIYSSGSTNLQYTVTAVTGKNYPDTVYIPGAIVNEGDELAYSNGGGTNIGGLTSGNSYYAARVVNGDRFNLSTTANPDVSSISIPQSSTFYVNATANIFQNYVHGFSTGDAVVYTSSTGTPVYNLTNDYLYYVRSLASNQFALYYSSADASSDSNRVNLGGTVGGSAIFTKKNIIDFTSVPSPAETHSLGADFTGAGDGIYNVSSTSADQLSFSLAADRQIQKRDFELVAQAGFWAAEDGLFATNHGFLTGDAVLYTETGSENITGLTDNTTYYVIRISKDFIKLATSAANAEDGTAITLTETGSSASAFTGTLSLVPDSILGAVAAPGTISYEASGTVVTGEGTSFTSYFNSGDSLFIPIPPATTDTPNITGYSAASDYFTSNAHGLSDGDAVRMKGTTLPANTDGTYLYFVNTSLTGDANNRFSLHYTATDAAAGTNKVQLSNIGSLAYAQRYDDTGSVIERVIDYVNSDFQITLETALPATAQTEAEYFLKTSLLIRSDGFALHRPYDGGVELIPSKNPDSTMIRQTRKYFRYQSGKGIQVSYAINFSPTSQIDTFTRSGTTGTITTRYPHRLEAGLTIVTSGSTNTSSDLIGTKTYDVTVSGSLFRTQELIDGQTITLYRGRTYKFDQSDSTNAGNTLRFSETEDGTHGGGTEYTTGVTLVGTPGNAGAYTQIIVDSGAPDILYVYSEQTADYGFTTPVETDANNNQANLWNGELEVLSAPTSYTATVELPGTPSDSSATGVVEYHVKNWDNSALRCGLFDDQNGLFFEYDGRTIYCCKRSSTQQISGYASLTYRSSEITGVNTKFVSQLSVGERIVIRGQTHVVTKISSDTLMYVFPSYRGTTTANVVVTKTKELRVPQTDWNVDPCDGTGPTGFKLDINKIQMAYMDYSWYGAGKVRFGFKDQHGIVRYVHEMVHGNFEKEAYMRSGNLPARYEIQNIGAPTYVPALAHWGTSVIMDGGFDPDKAYIFAANSNNITVTGSASLTAQAKVDYASIYYQYIDFKLRRIGYALELDTATSTLASVTPGTAITGADLAANTTAANPSDFFCVPYQPYMPNTLSREGTSYSTQATRNLMVIDKAPTGTAGASSTYTFGTVSGAEDVTKSLPLISIRLAPSVDTNTPGFLGEREIINRMQLILDSVGILSTHAVNIDLVFNGLLSVNDWTRVTNPSLSQLVLHTSADTIVGGSSIYNFRALGGSGTSGRQPELTTVSLSEVATLGNSILGGDNTFPDGPDVVTIVATLVEDPSTVTTSNPFQLSARISWSESQA